MRNLKTEELHNLLVREFTEECHSVCAGCTIDGNGESRYFAVETQSTGPAVIGGRLSEKGALTSVFYARRASLEAAENFVRDMASSCSHHGFRLFKR